MVVWARETADRVESCCVLWSLCCRPIYRCSSSSFEKMKVKTKRNSIKPNKKSWRKGDACVSNPQAKKYRDEVRQNRFIHGKSRSGKFI